ncbi:hypothetical protein SMSP2_00676 [Limihaloglobus sulfuriphilus]|uniref:Carbohydrate-binding domain-containing protein n=1 Tax=Limihaloglobus sulfuriphilus TaxID=1851148 RepID=A0A1Q2MCB2_9BACT|nr:sugar-binding protein [Limihaloglobus sulfuriphilus]AQQ70331.1 hypothetical protein SMSP2_00676 [Limihaloglobus sulfuriphilus]
MARLTYIMLIVLFVLQAAYGYHYNVPRAEVTPVIDGVLDQGEWTDSRYISMVYPDLVTAPKEGSIFDTEPPADASDYSLDWFVKWDDDYLYLAARVYDNVFVADDGNDEPQVCFNFRDDPVAEFLTEAIIWNVTVNRGFYTNTDDPSALTPDNSDVVGNVLGDGYVIEIRLAFADISTETGYQPKASDIHGFGLACQDHDAAGSRTTFMLDYGSGAPVIQDPSTWNTIILTDRQTCGDWEYALNDLNKDCVVDLLDFSLIAGYWLSCTDPTNENCLPAAEIMSTQQQLESLQSKQMIVPSWGYDASVMAAGAKEAGYQVGNTQSFDAWKGQGVEVLARPEIETDDPFDPADVQAGIDTLAEFVESVDSDQNVVGYVIRWGHLGEGGFPYDYEFSETARQAFNDYMGTPGEPLPTRPSPGNPGDMRWIKWIEFRSKTLRDFRETYISAIKQVTNKLVSTWSEFYATRHYDLNMGEAPGADFLFHDLSFGDVTTDQQIAFGECHGILQNYSTFESWRDVILPYMAKAAGDGVVPVAFHYPYSHSFDDIQQEFSLRIGSSIRGLIDTVGRPQRNYEVALVYNSFSAAALPQGSNPDSLVMDIYSEKCAKQVEGILQQLGVDFKVIAYEGLEYKDLSQYKLVIVPDPMYLTDQMRTNLAGASKVMYAGEYLMAHRSTQSGDYNTEFTAQTLLPGVTLDYFKAPAGQLAAETPSHRWLAGIDLSSNPDYPADQMFAFSPMAASYEVVLKVGSNPVLIENTSGNEIFITNRFFHNGWNLPSNWLETIQYQFLKNVLSDLGVEIPVESGQQVRVQSGNSFGSYGINGNVAWNATGSDVTITLVGGKTLTIPGYGWTLAD